MNNNPIVQTPQIEQLANDSQSFTNFHVDPTCSPTRAVLMSGKYLLRAGVWHTVMGRHMLSDQHHILPELLADAGYNTAMIGKWHLGDNYPFRPQDQGFNHVLSHGGGGVGQAPDYWGNDQFNDTYYLNGKEKQYKGFSTDVWFDEAIDFIHKQSNKDEPFFLYLSTNAPHDPWRAPEKYIEPYRALDLNDDMANFYGMITNIDKNIGRLRAAMQADKIEDNTIFIFMTDNGSSMAKKSNGEPLTWLTEDVKLGIEAKNRLECLESPGVLVLSQPIMEDISGDGDRNFVYYQRQYKKIIKAIHDAKHDVLVLSGDIHHGRISKVEFIDRPNKLIEVVSSPMSNLSGISSIATSVITKKTRLEEFPPIHVPGVPSCKVSYESPWRVSSESELLDFRYYKNRTKEHFYTLTVQKAVDGSLDVTVRAWLARERDKKTGLPKQDWKNTPMTFSLR